MRPLTKRNQCRLIRGEKHLNGETGKGDIVSIPHEENDQTEQTEQDPQGRKRTGGKASTTRKKNALNLKETRGASAKDRVKGNVSSGAEKNGIDPFP